MGSGLVKPEKTSNCVRVPLVDSVSANNAMKHPPEDLWLYLNADNKMQMVFPQQQLGSWLLYYPIDEMPTIWELTKNYFEANKLVGVETAKSINYNNKHFIHLDEGFIVLYCNDVFNKIKILNTGKKILQTFNYTNNKYIFFKVENTAYNKKGKSYLYKLINIFYIPKCKYCNEKLESLEETDLNVCSSCILIKAIAHDMRMAIEGDCDE